jgi:hypothetical protein
VKGWPLHVRLRTSFTRLLKIVGPAHIRAHKHCFRNRNEVERSAHCGCFYCLETFKPVEIQEWADKGATTALCPRCGIDSVIGSASGFPLTRRFLQQMNDRWFGESIKIGT